MNTKHSVGDSTHHAYSERMIAYIASPHEIVVQIARARRVSLSKYLPEQIEHDVYKTIKEDGNS